MENLVDKACKELGITQAELAERMGVSRGAVSQWRSALPNLAKQSLELMIENAKLKQKLEDEQAKSNSENEQLKDKLAKLKEALLSVLDEK